MIDTDAHLEDVAKAIREGRPSPSLTVRAFLDWFGAQRRGYWIVRRIRDSLKRAGLRTTPDFESTWIDGPISFALMEVMPESVTAEESAQIADTGTGSQAVASPADLSGTSAAESLPRDSATEALVRTSEATRSEPSEPNGPATGAVPGEQGDSIPSPPPEVETTLQGVRPGDPSHRISKLEAANHPPDRVAPDSSLIEAITIMLTNGYSQVPVMPTERDVKGVVTWKSIASRLALGIGAVTVGDAMDRVAELPSDASIFDAIPILVETGYVLVRGPDRRIVGIVTSSDLSLQFQQLAEPFLIIGEIENRIRSIIDERFELADLETVRDPDDPDRGIDSVDDLTFGEYIRLLEEPGRWARADLKVDRSAFIKPLRNVGRIRNAVMHFDPDGIPSEDIQSLRDFARFLRELDTLGVT